MNGQGTLFGNLEWVENADLVVAVKETIQLLRDEGALDARFGAKAQGILDLARDVVMARPGSIAKVNGFRLLHEQLNELLELEAPTTDEHDNPGDNITRLAEFLQARRVDPEVRNPSAS